MLSEEKRVLLESVLPDVRFGKADAKPLDWRELPEDSPDDDEPLSETPASIVAVLGFDPLESDGEV